jgi:hypothetical protein
MGYINYIEAKHYHGHGVRGEVFDLIGHPKANRICAWMHTTDDPAQPKRHVTVLHIPPVNSPQTAVKPAIVRELRKRDSKKEN